MPWRSNKFATREQNSVKPVGWRQIVIPVRMQEGALDLVRAEQQQPAVLAATLLGGPARLLVSCFPVLALEADLLLGTPQQRVGEAGIASATTGGRRHC